MRFALKGIGIESSFTICGSFMARRTAGNGLGTRLRSGEARCRCDSSAVGGRVEVASYVYS